MANMSPGKTGSSLSKETYYSEYKIGKEATAQTTRKSAQSKGKKSSAMDRAAVGTCKLPGFINWKPKQKSIIRPRSASASSTLNQHSAEAIPKTSKVVDRQAVIHEFEELNKLTSLEAHGFKNETEAKWIYPTNLQFLQYEYNIVRAALLQNCFVRLPEGLKKDLIASVILYNYNKWYPEKLSIFVAPTAEAATAQFISCKNCVGVDADDIICTSETDSLEARSAAWKDKRVLFTTTQVLLADITEGSRIAIENVRCLVLADAENVEEYENHKEIVNCIFDKTKLFRVVAFSSSLTQYHDFTQVVLGNLFISRLELRSAYSADIRSYMSTPIKRIVKVKLCGYAKETLLKCAKIVKQYIDRLAFSFGETCVLAPLITVEHLQECKQQFNAERAVKVTETMKTQINMDYAICIAFMTANEMTRTHGVGVFYAFVCKMCSNMPPVQGFLSAISQNKELREFLLSIENNFEVQDNESVLKTEREKEIINFSRMPAPPVHRPPVFKLNSHPKLVVVKNFIVKHFTLDRCNEIKAIIIAKFLRSCKEINSILETLGQSVRPIAISSGALDEDRYGEKAVKRMQDLSRFRKGEANVLIARPFDIQNQTLPEINLIICFDSESHSDKLIEKLKSTDKQRKTELIFLTTGEEEEKKLREIISNENIRVTDDTELVKSLCPKSPRMIPLGMELRCVRKDVDLTVNQKKDARVEISKISLAKPTSNKRFFSSNKDQFATSSQPVFGNLQSSKRAQQSTTADPDFVKLLPLIKTSVTEKDKAESNHQILKKMPLRESNSNPSSSYQQQSPLPTSSVKANNNTKSSNLAVHVGTKANTPRQVNSINVQTKSKSFKEFIRVFKAPTNKKIQALNNNDAERNEPIQLIVLDNENTENQQQVEASTVKNKEKHEKRKRVQQDEKEARQRAALLWQSACEKMNDPDSQFSSLSQHHYEPKLITNSRNKGMTEQESSSRNEMDRERQIKNKEYINDSSNKEIAGCKRKRKIVSQPSSQRSKSHKKKKVFNNDLILDQAEVSGSDSSGEEGESGEESDGSFIDNENEEITETQHFRYLRGIDNDL